ncbi:MAG: reverse transcriptase N-terminal domain-containing protein, partial [Xenococcus sp. MO_188.B8]|nr:reverse transcriptase N-terminal domain-containing protein [Xenococcus sp. MO_188.B8]
MIRHIQKEQRPRADERRKGTRGDMNSESWKRLPWKKFRKTLFRLQKRVWKAVRAGDRRKARSLQKLILKSQAARFLAIRQVTQLNAGKKTAGIDGKLALTFKER